MSVTRRSVLVGGLAVVAGAAAAPVVANAGTRRVTVGAGQTWMVPRTTRLGELVVADGGAVTAPDGYSLTLTVDGVDTGAGLTETGGADTAIVPGTYRGDVVLTVAVVNPIVWAGVSTTLTFPFRQALYVDGAGLVVTKSVPAAVLGGGAGTSSARGVTVGSTGECFTGLYVTDGTYTLRDARIALHGNGRCDFVGYGAAIVGTGSGTRLVVDNVTIDNRGAVRSGVIADGGAHLIVKNSRVHTHDGVLPSDYVPTVDTSYMESAPWMLGISGNVRATNLLGTNTRATYLNSTITSTGWGVLSSDNGSDGKLTAINCQVAVTGDDGYGSYAIGNATERFLGCRFDVATYATINRGGAVHYGDSTPAAVAALDTELGLGLTAAELTAIPVRNTVVNSRRFGFMWHGAGSLAIDGGTVVDTRETMFLDKGQQVSIAVDGSGGARLNPGNGILVQVMENDDPGPVVVDGRVVNEGVYTEPTGTPAKVDGFDVTAVHDTDAVATFTDIALRGDFYNGMRDPLNLVLTFERATVDGVISASSTRHAVSTVDADNYHQLGKVTNTAGAVINNGVLVTLAAGSTWRVAGTSYLSRLTLADGAAVVAPAGRTVTMTVDGVATAIAPGTYEGAVTLTVNQT